MFFLNLLEIVWGLALKIAEGGILAISVVGGMVGVCRCCTQCFHKQKIYKPCMETSTLICTLLTC